MTITHGQPLKKFILYPPAKPFLETEELVWVDLKEGDALFRVVSQPILTIDKALAPKDLDGDMMISNSIQNLYLPEVQIRECPTKYDKDELTDEESMTATVPRGIASISGLTSITYLDDIFTTKLSNPLITTIEIFPGKTLNINNKS